MPEVASKDEIKVCDFTGDGLDDLLLKGSLGRNDGGLRFSFTKWQGLPAKANWPQVFCGDVNGDRKADLFIAYSDRQNWQILLSNGLDAFVPLSEFANPHPDELAIPMLDGGRLLGIIFQKGAAESERITAVPLDAFQFSPDEASLTFPPGQRAVGFQTLRSTDPPAPILVFETTDGSGRMTVMILAHGAVWAQFPREEPLLGRDPLIGDFNGDGNPDLLFQLGDLGGWWIAISDGMLGIEHPIAGLHFREHWKNLRFFAGRFESQKRTSLMAVDPQHARFQIFGYSDTRSDGPPVGARSCISYRPFGREGKWGRTSVECPEGFAFIEVDDGDPRPEDVERAPFFGSCCPLPAKDVLTQQLLWEKVECPDGWIVTGRELKECQSCERKVKCRRVNTSRYRLAEQHNGRYWGFRASDTADGAISRSEIPLAVRQAFGRLSYRGWDTDGCTGRPIGALLTRIGWSCTTFGFRELLYTGAAGDPPTGTPVPMFPLCREPVNPFDPQGDCER